MGLLGKLFGKWVTRVLYSDSAHSTPFDRNLYEQETVRAIIDCIASHAAKAEAMHVILDDKNRIKEIKRNSPYVRLLNEKPNPLMTGYDMKYRLITQLEKDTTAYCYIKWKTVGNVVVPEMMIPIDSSASSVYPVEGGGYALKFNGISGEEYTVPLEDVVVLRKYYCDNEVYGGGNLPVYNTLNMLKASDEGLLNALSVANKVRGLLKQKQAQLDPADVIAATERFDAQFERAAAKGGVVGVDSMEDYTPLTVTPWAASSAQTKDIRDNLLRNWRMNDDILMSKYNAEQWQAFYESVIETILMAESQAFTAACFTPTERAFGNRIIFTSDSMQYMSLASKTTLVQATMQLGMFTKNEYRAMFGYAPIEKGDEPLVSLNYVKESDQSKYQTGEEATNGNSTSSEDAKT